MHLDVPQVDIPASATLEDLRPATERESKTFSSLITSSAFGIQRVGDGSLDPAPPQAFYRFAYDRLGREGEPLRIAVHHMVIYMNNKSALRSSSLAMGLGGAIGGAIGGAAVGALSSSRGSSQQEGVEAFHSLVDQTQFEALLDEEHERAYFAREENPGKSAVFVIYIDADINGKRVFTRSVAPIRFKDEKSNFNLAITEAFRYHLAEFQSGN